MNKKWKYGVLDDAVTRGSSNISFNKIKNDEGDFPVYGAKGFAQNISFFHQEKEYLAIIKDGAGIGRVSKHPAKSSVVGTMQYIIPKKGFDIDFIKYFLLGLDFESYRKGSTIPHVYYKDYKNSKFPLVGNKEQKNLVFILNETFKLIDQAKLNIEKNILNAKELFQSKLNEIFSQEDNKWDKDKLINITTKIGSGSTPRGGQSSYKSEGISLIRSMNVYDDGFRPRKLAFIDDEQAAKLKNVTIELGDVLLNITGASVARCCVVENKYLPARVNQHVSIIRPMKEKIKSDFLHLALTSKLYKDELLGIGEQGATRQAITKAQIEQFEIRFPKSLSEQKNVSKQISLISQLKTELISNYNQKLIELSELKKSILQKAFAGELTKRTH